jgi:hypothetical protein
MTLLLQLLLAHLLGDFFLQSEKWVQNKEEKKLRSPWLYVHVALHCGLLLLLAGPALRWPAALAIAATHLLIDGLKLQLQQPGTRRQWFFIDQLLHLAVLVAAWLLVTGYRPHIEWFNNTVLLIYVVAVLFLLSPASLLIKIFISRWSPNDTPGDNTLQSAGKLIGMLERLLVFAFVALGKWEGIGFMLAAKSVFRFGDLKDSRDRKLTEYVLIGTLLSFGLAIAAGLVTTNYLSAK